MAWNVLFKSSLPLSVRTQTGRLRTGLEYFASIERNAELTAVPVLDRSGTISRYFEKESMTLNRYIYIIIVVLTERRHIHYVTFPDVHQIRDSIWIPETSYVSAYSVCMYPFLTAMPRSTVWTLI